MDLTRPRMGLGQLAPGRCRSSVLAKMRLGLLRRLGKKDVVSSSLCHFLELHAGAGRQGGRQPLWVSKSGLLMAW